MADEIKADYQQLEQVASKFASESQAIQQMLQKVRSSAEKLENGGWIGRGSDAFHAEMNSLVVPKTTAFYEVLNKASQITKQISNTIKQAEQEASNVFKKAQ